MTKHHSPEALATPRLPASVEVAAALEQIVAMPAAEVPHTAVLDIETASSPAFLQSLAPADWALMDGGDQAAWTLERAADGATSALTGQVVCWAVATITSDGEDGPAMVVSGRTLWDEPWVLTALTTFLRRVRARLVVAHNGLAFDFPFLRARALAHGIDSLAKGLHQDKPWSGRLVDTLDPAWCPRPNGYRDQRDWSVSGLARLLGIPRAETISGEEVPKAWFRGQYDEVEAHCLDDVVTLRDIYRRLRAGRTG